MKLEAGKVYRHKLNGKSYEIVHGPWLSTRRSKERWMADVKCLDPNAKQHTRVMDTVNLVEAL
jgi:hypothetical protein